MWGYGDTQTYTWFRRGIESRAEYVGEEAWWPQRKRKASPSVVCKPIAPHFCGT